MKYKASQYDVAKALSLSPSQVDRLETVMSNAIESIHRNKSADFSFDEVSELVAPHILTPEEAWYCAFGLSSLLHKMLEQIKNH